MKELTKELKNKDLSPNHVEDHFYRIFNIIFSVVFSSITVLCVFFSGINYARKAAIITQFPPALFVIIGSAGILALFFLINKINTLKKSNIIILIISISFLTVQIIFTYNYFFYTDWDAGGILKVSEIIADGDIPGDQYDSYFSTYPNNLTLVFIFTAVIRAGRIFGILPVFSLIIFQCFIYWAGGLFLYFACKKLFKNDIHSLITYILYLLLIGISPWVTIPYSDSTALIFPIMIFFLLQLKPRRKISIILKWIGIGAISYLGYSIKPQVFFIPVAILLIYFIHVLFNKKRKKINLLKAALFLAGIIIAHMVLINVHTFTKINIDNEKSFGAQHFLMMGFNDKEMGVYSEDDVKYSRSFNTKDERNKKNLQMFKQRLEKMGVSGFFSLMAQKNLTNYNDGTFCWGGEGRFYVSFPERKQNPLSEFLKNVYYNRSVQGKYYHAWAYFEQFIWMGILVLSVFCINLKKPSKEITVLLISLLILTLFQSLFEARARYLFIYAPIYIITAVQGCRNISNYIRSLFSNNKKE